MQHLIIKVGEQNDTEPLFPDAVDAEEVTITGVGILEGGMQSGKTSLSLMLKGADGKQFVAQCSYDIFQAIAGAARGADGRFKLKRSVN